ncbi:hypothetical protein PFLUV_G00155350 [Perca fluviatilis]|uniref:Uncharacterized protein n=1 Tax=Perca fluviatilis TaxID=8168 RepID=A0A6A5EKS9_PERFL|nr:hypothetical protein PFLUV_G00155350 [Perca fluviatilis]
MEMSGLVEGWFSCIARVCVGAWLRVQSIELSALLLSLLTPPPVLPPCSPPAPDRDRQKTEEEQRTSQSTDSSNVRLVGYTGRSPRREEDITSRPFSIDQ